MGLPCHNRGHGRLSWRGLFRGGRSRPGRDDRRQDERGHASHMMFLIVPRPRCGSLGAAGHPQPVTAPSERLDTVLAYLWRMPLGSGAWAPSTWLVPRRRLRIGLMSSTLYGSIEHAPDGLGVRIASAGLFSWGRGVRTGPHRVRPSAGDGCRLAKGRCFERAWSSIAEDIDRSKVGSLSTNRVCSLALAC